MNNCTLCDKINATEKKLNTKAEALTNKVKELLRPSIEYNNKKWEKFAQYCRIPIIGEGIFLIFNSPSLKETFKYWDETWYNKTGRAIEKEATYIEKLKQEDIRHWSNELVTPLFWDDPSAYYYPLHKLRRNDCLDTAYVQFMKEKCSDSVTDSGSKYNKNAHTLNIEEHLKVLDKEFEQYKANLKASNKTITNTETYDIWFPEKYAFTRGEYDRLHAESKVMDYITKSIVPKNQCNFFTKNNKVFYNV